MATVGACLVVVGVWLCFAAVFMGLGRATRRMVSGERLAWTLGDFWTGIAVAISVVTIAHLFLPVDRGLWIALIPLALLGLCLPSRPVIRRDPRLLLWLAVGVAIALYVADRALQPMTNFDSGLYHLPVVDWYREYRAVPGLGNFHLRLAYNSGMLVLDAMTATAVPPDIAHHFTNSLLMTAACVEVLAAMRLLARKGASPAHYAPSVLLILAAPGLLRSMHWSYEISSTSVDLPAVALTLVAALYAGRVLASGRTSSAVLVPTAALLALLPVLRVQMAVFSGIAGLVILVAILNGGIAVDRRRRLLARLAVLMGIIVGAWAAHGVVLSGYPMFPATFLGMPVDWRVPRDFGVLEQDWIKSWARQPGPAPDAVLGNTAWLRPWSVRTAENPDVQGMIVLLGSGVVLLAVMGLSRRMASRSAGRLGLVAFVVAAAAMAALVVAIQASTVDPILLLASAAITSIAAAVLTIAYAFIQHRQAIQRGLLSLATLAAAAAATSVAWFELAPDPRFAIGVLWLTAAVPAAVALSWLWVRQRPMAVLGLFLSVIAAALFPVLHLEHDGMLAPATATKTDVWGLESAPVGVTREVRSRGLSFYVPVEGAQCWADSLPCTPYPDLPWQLREAGNPGSGFRMTKSVPERPTETP